MTLALVRYLKDLFTFPPKIHTSRAKLGVIFKDATKKDLDMFYYVFSKYARAYLIEDVIQENFFLAQIVAETGQGLSTKRENLNYSTEGLKSTFSYYRAKPSEAVEDGRNNTHAVRPEAIANKAYANRIGNGGVASGDGYRYRGGGYLQLTGKANYERITWIINLVEAERFFVQETVGSIETVSTSLRTAMAFWYDSGCNSCKHIDCVTKKVNKYTTSYGKRKELYLWISRI